jgi:tetratricopeptide (TPR) repeat protein
MNEKIRKEKLDYLINLYGTADMKTVIKEAVKVIEQYKSATAYNILALAHKRSGNYETAQKIYEQLLIQNPKNVLFLGNLGNIYDDLGYLDRAEQCFVKCLELDKHNYNVSVSLAHILQSKSKFSEALDILKVLLENSSYGTEANLNDLNYRIAELYRSMGSEYGQKAIKHYVSSDNPLSDSHRLELIYTQHSKDEFLKAEREIVQNGAATPLLGAVQSHAAVRYNKNDENLFCRDPFKFIHHSKLTEDDGFNGLLVSNLLNLKSSLNTVSQSLLHNGEQSAGNFLLSKDPSIVLIRNIILRRIEHYRRLFAEETDAFITQWPENYELHGWIVDIRKGGSLGGHMHKLGWLSGSLYLKIPIDLSTSEGNIVFSTNGAGYPTGSQIFPEKEVNIETGDIVLFPSSVFHRTLPFDSLENRVTLAFDIKPLI